MLKETLQVRSQYTHTPVTHTTHDNTIRKWFIRRRKQTASQHPEMRLSLGERHVEMLWYIERLLVSTHLYQ